MTDPYLQYLRKRNRRRYADFVAAYQGIVTRLVWRVVRCRDEAQDIVQEVFARLGAVKTPRETPLNPRAYVLGAALNLARSHLRDKARRLHHEHESGKLKVQLSPSVLDELVARESVERLYRAIDNLPEELRVAIHLRAIEGLSYKDVADVTGASLETVGVRIHRARSLLRKSLGSSNFTLAVVYAELARAKGWISSEVDVCLETIPRSLVERVFTRSRGVAGAGLASCGLAALALTALLSLHARNLDQEYSMLSKVPEPQARARERQNPLANHRATNRSSASRRTSKGTFVQPSRAQRTASLSDEIGDNEVNLGDIHTSKTGEDSMSRLTFATAPFFLTAALAAPVLAENFGDINGDGRVSFADAFWFDRWVIESDPFFEPRPGSAEFEGVFDCSNGTFSSPERIGYEMPELLYLESLRRVSLAQGLSPLPHFAETWPAPSPADPHVAVDPDFVVEVLPAVHRSSSDLVHLELLLETPVPLQAMTVVFRAEELDLRPDRTEPSRRSDDLTTSTEFYVLSHGLLAYRSDFGGHVHVFDAGGVVLTFPARVPKGSVSGRYLVEILEGTELVTLAGDVIRPARKSSFMELEREITQGHDLTFPPLEFDAERGQVAGRTEFRITDAEAFPGDEVRAYVQMRTDVPISEIDLYPLFDADLLTVNAVYPLYEEVDDRMVHRENYSISVFHASPPRSGEMILEYWGSGEDISTVYRTVGVVEPTLKYFSPLGEWIGLFELRITINEEAEGVGETRIDFFERPSRQGATFPPYVRPGWAGCQEEVWSYDVVYTPGRIKVLGGGEPPPPPPPPIDPEVADIRYALGSAAGSPGDLVKLPVEFRSAVDLYALRLVLEYNTTLLAFEGIDINLLTANGEEDTHFLEAEDPFFGNMICEGEGWDRRCREGRPRLTQLYGPPFDEMPENVILADFFAPPLIVDEDGTARLSPLAWTTDETFVLGSLVFRVRERARAGRVEIGGVETTWIPGQAVTAVVSVTSGYPLFLDPPHSGAAVPAVSVEAGVVTITTSGAENEFIRGDSNRDGSLNVSDPAHTLAILFGGGVAEELSCEDAADANDDGSLNLADSVYVLNHLFGGGPPPPSPFPEAGTDPTDDELECQ